MSKNDTIEQVIQDGQDKMTENVQKRLLTHLSGKSFENSRISPVFYFSQTKTFSTFILLAGLDRSQDDEFSEDEFLKIPTSRLSLLLNLSVSHADNFRLQESDKRYLEGWQHALLCLKGKYQTFDKLIIVLRLR